MEVLNNFSLKELNTFGLNVNAKKIVKLFSEEDVLNYFNYNVYKKDDSLILGSGSNILFTKDFEGSIFKSEINGIKEIKKDTDNIFLEVGSGVIWSDLINYCITNGYGGIENLTLIPGTVGAAPIQNIGAYGVEFEEVFDSLDGIDLINLEKKNFSKSDCEFGYRDSIFKREFKNTFLITKVRIKLSLKPEIKTSYRAIQDYIKSNKINNIDIKVLSDIVAEIRKSKLPDPTKLGNAGSFFKNPVIDEHSFIELKKLFKDLVYFQIDNSSYKIPAGWLIEKAGYKGKKFGNVGVHKDQALVLVNYGNCKGSELANLAYEIKSKIFNKFNIVLDTEVNIV